MVAETEADLTPLAATLPRPRLIRLMLARFDRRLVALRSGPGFGKTTLLGQAVAENALSPRGVDVWLTCGPHHRAGLTLASDLVAALGLEDPAPIDIEATVRTMGELISSRSPVDVALLL